MNDEEMKEGYIALAQDHDQFTEMAVEIAHEVLPVGERDM
jgi:hypothetical protein